MVSAHPSIDDQLNIMPVKILIAKNASQTNRKKGLCKEIWWASLLNS